MESKTSGQSEAGRIRPTRVTSDLSDYDSLSVTKDGQSLLAIESQPTGTVFVGKYPSTGGTTIDPSFTQITTDQAIGNTLGFTSEGQLAVEASGQLWLMDPDGKNRRKILDKERKAVWQPSRCGPNRLVVDVARANTFHLFRYDLSEGGMQELSTGADEGASCTPDGKWVFYLSDLGGGMTRILKVPADGGQAVEVAHGRLNKPVVSPNGKMIAYMRTEGQTPNETREYVIQGLESGPPLKVVPVPDKEFEWSWYLSWAPDSNALVMARRPTTVVNLWLVPITGSEPIQLTHFTSEPELIIAADFSPDGKKIAITRMYANNRNAVLFTNFR